MRILLLLLAFVISAAGHADELEKAYQKEFAYLVAEKEALQQRLQLLKDSHRKNIGKLQSDIDSLQRTYLSRQNLADRYNKQILEASRDADFGENDSLLLDATLQQALESISKLDGEVDESASQAEQLAAALSIANNVIIQDVKVSSESGEFFSH